MDFEIAKKGDKNNIIKKKNIIKCYLIGKYINFFQKSDKRKISFSVTKNLKNSIKKIFDDIKFKNYSEKSILLSPAAASFDQYEKTLKIEGKNLRKYVNNMQGKFI